MLNVNFIYIRFLGELYEDETKNAKYTRKKETELHLCFEISRMCPAPSCSKSREAKNENRRKENTTGKWKMKIHKHR
jgi:hypothetical protein